MLDGIRGVISLLAAVGIVATVAGFFGRMHPAFDTLGVFRLQALVAFGGLFAFALMFRALTARYLSLIGALFAATGIVPFLLPEDPVADAQMRVFSQNLRFDNPTPDRVLGALYATEPDVVLLQEMSDANREALRPLEDRYRTRIFCPFEAIGGIEVLTRYPAVSDPVCAEGQGVAWARVKTPWGEVTLVSLHLHWPWPYGAQAAQADAVAGLLAELEEPVLIGGDFNIAPWSHAVDEVEASTGTRVLRGLRLTLQRDMFWPGLPLDHLLVSEDLAGQVRQLGTNGSDHRALVADIRFLRGVN